MPITLTRSAYKLPVQQHQSLTPDECQALYDGATPVYDYAPAGNDWQSINWEAYNHQFKQLGEKLKELSKDDALFLNEEEARKPENARLYAQTKSRAKYLELIITFVNDVLIYQEGNLRKTRYTNKNGNPNFFRDLKYALEVILLKLMAELAELKTKQPYNINDKISVLKRFHEAVDEASVCDEGAYQKLTAMKEEIRPNRGIQAIVAAQLNGVIEIIGAQHNQRVLDNLEIMIRMERDEFQRAKIRHFRDTAFIGNQVHTPDFIKMLFQAKGIFDGAMPALKYDRIPKVHQKPGDPLFYLNDPNGNVLCLTDVDLNETFENEFKKRFNENTVIENLTSVIYESIRGVYRNCARKDRSTAEKRAEASAQAYEEVHALMVEWGLEGNDAPHEFGFFDTMDEETYEASAKSDLEMYYWANVHATRLLAKEELISGVTRLKISDDYSLEYNSTAQWIVDNQTYSPVLLSDLPPGLLENLVKADHIQSFGLAYALSKTFPAEFDARKPLPSNNTLRVRLHALAHQFRVVHNLAQVFSSQPVFAFKSIEDLKTLIDKFMELGWNADLYRVRLALEKYSRSEMQARFCEALNEPQLRVTAMGLIKLLNEVEPPSNDTNHAYQIKLLPATIYISEAYLASLIGKTQAEVEYYLPYCWRGQPPEKIPDAFHAAINYDNIMSLFSREVRLALFEIYPPLITTFCETIPEGNEKEALLFLSDLFESVKTKQERANLLKRLWSLSKKTVLAFVSKALVDQCDTNTPNTSMVAAIACVLSLCKVSEQMTLLEAIAPVVQSYPLFEAIKPYLQAVSSPESISLTERRLITSYNQAIVSGSLEGKIKFKTFGDLASLMNYKRSNPSWFTTALKNLRSEATWVGQLVCASFLIPEYAEKAKEYVDLNNEESAKDPTIQEIYDEATLKEILGMKRDARTKALPKSWRKRLTKLQLPAYLDSNKQALVELVDDNETLFRYFDIDMAQSVRQTKFQIFRDAMGKERQREVLFKLIDYSIHANNRKLITHFNVAKKIVSSLISSGSDYIAMDRYLVQKNIPNQLTFKMLREALVNPNFPANDPILTFDDLFPEFPSVPASDQTLDYIFPLFVKSGVMKKTDEVFKMLLHPVLSERIHLTALIANSSVRRLFKLKTGQSLSFVMRVIMDELINRLFESVLVKKEDPDTVLSQLGYDLEQRPSLKALLADKMDDLEIYSIIHHFVACALNPAWSKYDPNAQSHQFQRSNQQIVQQFESSDKPSRCYLALRNVEDIEGLTAGIHYSGFVVSATEALRATYRPRLQTILSDALLTADTPMRVRLFKILENLASKPGYYGYMFLTRQAIAYLLESQASDDSSLPPYFTWLKGKSLLTVKDHASFKALLQKNLGAMSSKEFLENLVLVHPAMLTKYLTQIEAYEDQQSHFGRMMGLQAKQYSILLAFSTAANVVDALKEDPCYPEILAIFADGLANHANQADVLLWLVSKSIGHSPVVASTRIKSVAARKVFSRYPDFYTLDAIAKAIPVSADPKQLSQDIPLIELLITLNLESNTPKTVDDLIALIRKPEVFTGAILRILFDKKVFARMMTTFDDASKVILHLRNLKCELKWLVEAINTIESAELREEVLVSLLSGWVSTSRADVLSFKGIISSYSLEGFEKQYAAMKSTFNITSLVKGTHEPLILDDVDDLREFLKAINKRTLPASALKGLYQQLTQKSSIERSKALFCHALLNDETHAEARKLLTVLESQGAIDVFYSVEYINALKQRYGKDVPFDKIPDSWKLLIDVPTLNTLVDSHEKLIDFAKDQLKPLICSKPHLVAVYLTGLKPEMKLAAGQKIVSLVASLKSSSLSSSEIERCNHVIVTKFTAPGFATSFQILLMIYRYSMDRSPRFALNLEACLDVNKEELTLQAFITSYKTGILNDFDSVFNLIVFKHLIKDISAQALIELLGDSFLMGKKWVLDLIRQHPQFKAIPQFITFDQAVAIDRTTLSRISDVILVGMPQDEVLRFSSLAIPPEHVARALLSFETLSEASVRHLEALFLSMLRSNQEGPLRSLFLETLIHKDDIRFIDLNKQADVQLVTALFYVKVGANAHGREYKVYLESSPMGLFSVCFYHDPADHIYLDWFIRDGKCTFFLSLLGNNQAEINFINRSSSPQLRYHAVGRRDYKVEGYTFDMSDEAFNAQFFTPLNLKALFEGIKFSLLPRFRDRLKGLCDTDPNYLKDVFQPNFLALLSDLIKRGKGALHQNDYATLVKIICLLPRDPLGDKLLELINLCNQNFYPQISNRTSLREFLDLVKDVPPDIYRPVICKQMIGYFTLSITGVNAPSLDTVRDDLLSFIKDNHSAFIEAKIPLKAIYQLIFVLVPDPSFVLPIFLNFIVAQSFPVDETIDILVPNVTQDNLEGILTAIDPCYWEYLLCELNILPGRGASFLWLQEQPQPGGELVNTSAGILRAYQQHRREGESLSQKLARNLRGATSEPQLIAILQRISTPGRYSVKDLLELKPALAKHFAEIYKKQTHGQPLQVDIVTRSILDSLN